MTDQRTGTRDPHLYGTPDPDNPPSPAPEGMRGERALQGDKPQQRRRVASGDRPIEVEEDSGIAFAEAEGHVATAKPKP